MACVITSYKAKQEIKNTFCLKSVLWLTLSSLLPFSTDVVSLIASYWTLAFLFHWQSTFFSINLQATMSSFRYYLNTEEWISNIICLSYWCQVVCLGSALVANLYNEVENSPHPHEWDMNKFSWAQSKKQLHLAGKLGLSETKLLQFMW